MKKILSLFLTFITIFSFTACGSSEKLATSNTNLTKQANGSQSLTLWCGSDELPIYQKLIDSFKASHKNVTIKTKDMSSNDIKDLMVSDVKKGADVFILPDDQLMTLAAAGILEPMNNDTIKQQDSKDSINAASIDGKLYAYPITADNGYFLYYNKKYLKESQVKSLDSILKIAKKHNKKFIMDWSSGWYLYSFFGNTGMHLELAEDGLTTNCNWNSKKGKIKGTDVAKAMLRISKNSAFQNGYDFAEQAKKGKAIAGVSGMWDVKNIEKAFGKDYGACKLPTYTCNGKQVQLASFNGYRMLGVNSYSANKELALEFANYVAGEDGQKLFLDLLGRGPANTKLAQSDKANNSAAISAVLAQIPYGTLQKVGPTYWTPTAEFGSIMSSGDLGGKKLQVIMDDMVSKISA